MEEQLAKNITTIDILANDTLSLERYDHSTHKIYQDLKLASHVNTFRENALLPGDEAVRQDSTGISPGWYLDRYKFLPMLRHAHAVSNLGLLSVLETLSVKAVR